MESESLALLVALVSVVALVAALVWPRGRQWQRQAEALAAESAALTERLGRAETELAAKQAQLGERSTALATLAAERQALAGRLEEAQRESAETRQQLARVTEAQAQIERQAQEKLALLEEARERMTKEFKLLSAEILSQQGQSFAKQHETKLTELLDPFRRRISEFQESLSVVQRESTRERAGLAEQIKALRETGQRMSLETQNLTRALKGKSQTQGVWGEMLLSSILERSGLREGEEFSTQVSHSDETGQRLRPDVIIHLPNGERIVVDAKVSLTAFESYANAETPEERAAALSSHARSLREHLRGLGAKGYQALAGGKGPDFVIMFVPIEEALTAALQQARDLVDDALNRNVVMATPTTLMVTLRTVHSLWQIDRRTKNVEEIAERGGLLYDKFVGFVEDLQKLGKRMDEARHSYDQALGKLAHGRGNLVGQAEKLRELGAKVQKQLPAQVLDQAGALPVPNSGDQASDDAA